MADQSIKDYFNGIFMRFLSDFNCIFQLNILFDLNGISIRLGLSYAWRHEFNCFFSKLYIYINILCYFCTQLYDVKYSYFIQIICIYLYDFKYSFLILIIIWTRVIISIQYETFVRTITGILRVTLFRVKSFSIIHRLSKNIWKNKKSTLSPFMYFYFCPPQILNL